MKQPQKYRPTRAKTAVYQSRSIKFWHSVSLFVFVLLMILASHGVHAGQLHLLLNGKAKHVNPPANSNYNEDNWGGGFQYEYGHRTSLWVPFVTASGFIDSLERPSYYAGGGVLRRYLLSRKLDDLHVDLGVVGFVMTRHDYYDGRPFLGALPVMSFGTKMMALNITYIPAVDKRIAQLWFMQLKVSAKNFIK